MTNLLTTDELAQYAPDLDTSGFSSTTVSGLIAQATKKIANFCNVNGFDFARETNEMERALINNRDELLISPKRRPVTNVVSIQLVRGTFSVDITLTDSNGNLLYHLPNPGNRVVVPNSYLFLTGTYLAGGNSQLISLKYADLYYKITYDAGYTTIPDDLKDACALWVRDMVNRKNNPTGAQSFSQGSYSVNYGANTKGESRFLSEAKDILLEGDYVRVEGT